MAELSGKEKYKDRVAKRQEGRSVLTIQPGCIYYDLDSAPIGGLTGRAPDGGLAIGDINKISLWHGCNRTGQAIESGKKVAFHTEYTREYYHVK